MPQITEDKPGALINGFGEMREGIRSEYRMTSTGPNKQERPGTPIVGVSADWYARNESRFYRMLERSREIRINDPIVGKGIQRLTTNIIQDGFIPNPDSGDEDADLAILDEWNAWIESPEIQGVHSWNDCERLAFSAVVSDGDSFGVAIDDDGTGRLQFLESHLCVGPTKSQYPTSDVILGVEQDGRRKRVAYWFKTDSVDPNKYSKDNNKRRISRFGATGIQQAFQVYFPDRFTQTRGVPAIQSCDDFVTYHDSVQFAQLVKQQVSSCWSILEEMALGGVPGVNSAAPNSTSTPYDDGVNRMAEQLFPGKRFVGAPGATLKGFSPNVPNAEYFEHVMMMLQIIAINLDLPVQVLMLDPSNTNFSGWRGAIDQAKQRWADLQRMLCIKLHKPVYKWKVWEWSQRNRFIQRAISNGFDVNKVHWRMPAWPYIEPMKDAQADDYVVATLQNSRRRVMAKRGLQYETVLPEIIADHSQAIIAAKIAAQDINQQFPGEEAVRWQEVLSLPLPRDIAISWSDSQNNQQQGATNGSN